MLKKLFVVGSFAVAMALSAGVAHADSYSYSENGVNYMATVSSSSVQLTVECTSSTCSGWYLGDISLKGFTFTGFSAVSQPSGYTLMAGGMDDSAGGGCNSTQPTSALCWDNVEPKLLPLTQGMAYLFSATLTGGSVSGTIHLQAVGFDNTDGSQKAGGKTIAISQDLVSTPEPGTLLLLGFGLFGLALVRRHAPSA